VAGAGRALWDGSPEWTGGQHHHRAARQGDLHRRPDRVPDRIAQVALALKLDGHYTKPAILSMYLSAVYFGNGYFGVLAASEGYFGVPPAS